MTAALPLIEPLHILCAGAAQGIVNAVQAEFTHRTGAGISGRFGAVGALREALQTGQPCDVMIVTAGMIDELCQAFALRADSRASLGRVLTGVAVCRDAPQPAIDTPAALKSALLAAQAIYFPDPLRATAGIHFAAVMTELGIHAELQARFRSFPNGATAMREMAADGAAGLIGCTQVSEILYTDGVDLVGPLPAPFELSTLYSAAICTASTRPALAQQFIEMLCGSGSLALREVSGYVVAQRNTVVT